MPRSKRFIDLTGQRFGLLLVLGDSGKSDCGGGVIWRCRCKCGRLRDVRSTSLRLVGTRSCGSCSKIRHGQSRTHVYFIWQGVKRRCLSPTDSHWPDYGGRGITVSPRWTGKNGFQNFLRDIPPRPSMKHTLDRINNDGNYERGNVRWATAKKQRANQRPRRSHTVEEECGIA
jgi:hypothetical protein